MLIEPTIDMKPLACWKTTGDFSVNYNSYDKRLSKTCISLSSENGTSKYKALNQLIKNVTPL